MDLLRLLPGAERVLAARDLPQPDQLCGPFSARAALYAVLPASSVPTMTELAREAGTRVWPYDIVAWRPAGAPLVRDGWDQLSRAASVAESGTDATEVAGAVTGLVGDRVAVVPASGDDWSGLGLLLDGLIVAAQPIGVLANVRTGPIAPPTAPAWDVGHFVVIAGVAGGSHVLVADTYAESGAPDQPPGCRFVDMSALGAALVDRGLLLFVAHDAADDVRRLVGEAGLTTDLWAT